MEDKELEQQSLYLRAMGENNLPYFFNLQTRTSSWSSPTYSSPSLLVTIPRVESTR